MFYIVVRRGQVVVLHKVFSLCGEMFRGLSGAVGCCAPSTWPSLYPSNDFFRGPWLGPQVFVSYLDYTVNRGRLSTRSLKPSSAMKDLRGLLGVRIESKPVGGLGSPTEEAPVHPMT